MSLTTESFSMQGRVSIGKRNADGSRMPAQWLANASTLEWDFAVETDDAIESFSGARGVLDQLDKSKKMTVKITITQLNDNNAALALGGNVVPVTGGTATSEEIGDVKAGDVVALQFAKVSALTLAGTAPAAPVLDTDYTLNADTGILTFLTDCTGVSASTYTYAAHSLVTALTAAPQDYYVLFDGQNTVRGAKGLCRGEVNRIGFAPADALGLITDSFGNINLSGEARIDPVRLTDPKYGGYARLMLIDRAA
jgi:hypothetical protein